MFHFELPASGRKPEVGQHITMSSLYQGERCEGTYTVIDKKPDGSVTVAVKKTNRNGLADLLHAGARDFQYEGCAGLPLPRHPKMLLLCGGIGVTPALALLRNKRAQYPDSDLHIVLSVETLADLPFLSELMQCHLQDERIRIDVFLTRATLRRQQAPYHQGRLNADALRAICPDLADRSAHIYGSAVFSQAVRAMLREASAAVEREEEQSQRGVVSAGGQGIPHNGQTTLLELMEEARLPVKSRCRIGVCGTCRVQLRAGRVKEEDSILSQSDRDQGIVLACCSIPQGDVAVEFVA